MSSGPPPGPASCRKCTPGTEGELRNPSGSRILQKVHTRNAKWAARAGWAPAGRLPGPGFARPCVPLCGRSGRPCGRPCRMRPRPDLAFPGCNSCRKGDEPVPRAARTRPNGRERSLGAIPAGRAMSVPTGTRTPPARPRGPAARHRGPARTAARKPAGRQHGPAGRQHGPAGRRQGSARAAARTRRQRRPWAPGTAPIRWGNRARGSLSLLSGGRRRASPAMPPVRAAARAMARTRRRGGRPRAGRRP